VPARHSWFFHFGGIFPSTARYKTPVADPPAGVCEARHAMNITPIVYAMGVGRILIGLAPIAAPQLSSKLLRFPAEHDNATARLMGRFFGVRDIGLGVLVIYAVADIALLKWIFLFQAATDAADALCIAPNLRDPKMKKAAAASLAFALGGGSLWLIARALA